jgi:predicted DNA-binding protein
MKDARVTVRFPNELRLRLRAEAGRKGVRESDLVRLAVEHELASVETSPTAYDLARRSGLIGAVRSGIRDLSTNPRHLDGFGQ